MYLAWIALRDFRSYAEFDFTPEQGVNVLVGDNAAGKTNVLEAVAYLSMLRSMRRVPDAALVREGASEAIVRGGFMRETGEIKVEVALPAEGRRSVLFNGKRPARYSLVAAEVPLVAFLPDDLDVVKRSPGLRREYLDDLAQRLTPSAGADLGEYEKAVRHRNALLRRQGRQVDPVSLDVWDEQIAELGARVLGHRLRLLDRLTPLIEASYHTVGGAEALTWHYRSSWAGVVDDETSRHGEDHVATLAGALAERRRRDIDSRTTSAGPHRDDPQFLVGGRDTRVQASQGEQRSVALSLRIAAYRLLEERHGHPPLLLLDDVFSELDPTRATGVMDLLPRGQVFVTSAREDGVPLLGRVWHVAGGMLR